MRVRAQEGRSYVSEDEKENVALLFLLPKYFLLLIVRFMFFFAKKPFICQNYKNSDFNYSPEKRKIFGI